MSRNNYLSKHVFYPKQIQTTPSPDLGIVIVIPCYNETGLISSLDSLWKCERPACSVEVIVVVNSSEKESEEVLKQNALTVNQCSAWIKEHSCHRLKFYIIEAINLPEKHAGVGLARKVGMDEAVVRFEVNFNKDGIIVCFDADCTCDSNYLTAIENHFKTHPKTPGCSLYYEHPVRGNEFDAAIYEGIIDYELFLRYYNQGLRFSGFPFAYQTVGSAMAVKSGVYQKQGGMNKRKAGEDFYFLQKIIPLGNYTELSATRVIPSPRTSFRVPFGTGKAIQKWLDKKELLTYHPQTFADLKLFFKEVPRFYSNTSTKELIYSLPEPLISFLMLNDYESKMGEIRSNSSSEALFIKRFYGWFNSFMILKYVHYLRDNFYKQVEIGLAAMQLLKMISEEINMEAGSKQDLLFKYREIERRSFFCHNNPF